MSSRPRLSPVLRRAAQLSPTEMVDLARAAHALFNARLAFAKRPAKTVVAHWLRAQDTPPPPVQRPKRADDLARVGSAIRTAARLVPWRADCLVQSVAALTLLRGMGYWPQFKIGVEIGEDGALFAHAYTTCDGTVINAGAVDRLVTLAGPMDETAGPQRPSTMAPS
ncbi:MAG: lasso peptide biosynthesis B2 protein [Pseudomonadota bacterium]